MFLDHAVQSMTRIALEPVQTEQRALATSLDVNMTKVSHQLAAVPGVTRADRFAAADVFVRTPGSSTGGASARPRFASVPTRVGAVCIRLVYSAVSSPVRPRML